ncbi:MAG: phage integrase N-terminal SAM-like domain-containing protein, partial [Proteobacteria bacterium]|nr:phage integrase N-terminal SAM-like domain-containing protein [Pseudomonadota bacterium]
MKVSSAINFCLQYHKISSRTNTIKNYTFLLSKFGIVNNDREMESIATEEIISFLIGLSEGRKQNTKRCRYTTLSAFFNLIINTLLPEMRNPCQSPAAKSLFRKPMTSQ